MRISEVQKRTKVKACVWELHGNSFLNVLPSSPFTSHHYYSTYAATILNFVQDKEAFHVLVCDRFAYLDTNHGGLLSYAEMLKELQCLRVFETHFGIDVKPELGSVYESLFDQFDHHSNGTVDLEEFEAETERMLVAVATGLGFLPVQMVLEEDSFLKKAVDREFMSKVAA
ncbi:hypothetical protein FEM48_Zijuj04G0128900 [Ziziphus jujuba var. spinosa]|uniref:EF-hand domain-containing protein n=1 Tax=Ziziphus jujuba var. spinosa TaxID=714518 RepID=A0A978VK02_ZIZJJ|nr:hypothetical protein FEM48_Zijuj04G0128900 [Ziziphus jujuba var. spinosa]